MNNIYNFTEELQKYGLTTNTYEKVCKDISDKLEGNNDLDWSEIRDKYNITCNPDTIRKASLPSLVGNSEQIILKIKFIQIQMNFQKKKN